MLLFVSLTIVLIFVVAIGCRSWSFFEGSKFKAHFRRFTYNPQLNAYTDAFPRADLSGQSKMVKHAVLLLHGFNGSPKEIEILCPLLKEAKIPYYAPLLTGHGLGTLDLFSAAQPSDWLRDVFNAFELLSTLAEEVSVFGHSTGAILALYLAQKRQVKHLILIAPNLVTRGPKFFDGLNQRMFAHPTFSKILTWLQPFYTKSVKPNRVANVDILDPTQAMISFYFPVIPTTSIKAMYSLQRALNLSQTFHFKDLTILYGKQDQTVDVLAGLTKLDSHGISYQTFIFEGSGHNILEDFDRTEAANKIIEILTGEA